MVELVYDGNLGNNLFQYSFARILAERLGYRLFASPIVGFPGTYDSVDGRTYPKEETRILRGQKPDLTFLNDGDPRCHLLLTGYFQRAEYYEPYAHQIRQWLAIDGGPLDTDIGPNDVVMGIRRGRDYIPRHGLPVSYYEKALSSISAYHRVFICTNEPADPFIQHFKRKYGAVVRTPSALDNLIFIKKFNKIIISNSTFLWWGAFLSNANEIVFPRPANGYWSPNDPLSKNLSLEVSEKRYRYLSCERYRSEFAFEILGNSSRELIRLTKATVKRLVPFATRDPKDVTNALVFSEDLD